MAKIEEELKEAAENIAAFLESPAKQNWRTQEVLEGYQTVAGQQWAAAISRFSATIR